ncbi:HNH endonuclease [Pseudomonas sp. NPDC089406]|uniref:HNH endonuclease n=1 Tax=Pseudomonas sp. NPDC089406 TaxID=3364463 RepID=UPI00385098C2
MKTPPSPTTILGQRGILASNQLKPGMVYTRNDLSTLFDIKDATLKNGIFHPKGFDSVWLFITEHKTSDRTQYTDSLSDNTLHMQGQRLGRTDNLILDHRQLGLELLLFYRRRKYEHPHAGFRYEGTFDYQSHFGSLPTSFTLTRNPFTHRGIALAELEQQLNSRREFNPNDLSDARSRIEASIVQRRGQPEFRKQLLNAYQGRCAVTGCTIMHILEAAHIHPYLGDKTNVTPNGILLRADIHTLFDLGLIKIRPYDLHIEISEELRLSEYSPIEGRKIFLPKHKFNHPNLLALEFKYNATKTR